MSRQAAFARISSSLDILMNWLQRRSSSALSSRRKSLSKALRTRRRRMVVESLEARWVMANNLIISEFLASNSDGLRDSDGESSDWIEIYNPTPNAVNLSGWRLTDDAGDLNQWTFPNQSLDSNEFLVVFASGKNRAIAGTELHTNFRLSSDGDFLALVDPSGVIVSEYAPTYPIQATNVSYGVGFLTDTYLTLGSTARTLVPTNGALGSTWTATSFSDASWSSSPIGVGFGLREPGFDVTYVKANTTVDDVNEAIQILSDPSQQTQSVFERVTTVNYMGNGGGGHYAEDEPFPTQSIGDDINDFIVRATSTVRIPAAGNWSFGVNSDDGFRLTLTRNGIDYVVEYPWQRAPADTVQSLALPEAGEYQLNLVMYERAGGASVELFAAQGSFSAWTSDFRLVGDTASGGLGTAIAIPAGPSSPIRTDIQASMFGINASAYLRIPFQVTNPNTLDSLRLKMRYDDGFVAYLNGVEVLRRNAPATVDYQSSSVSDLSMDQTSITESVSIAGFLGALQAGTNVLAVQGLNSSALDDSFFLIPELIGSQLLENDRAFFEVPTPGGPNGSPSLGIVDRVSFDTPSGFYDTSFQVSLASATPGALIRYTLDGSTPTPSHGTTYVNPIPIAKTSTLRAVSFLTGYVSLPSTTQTYLFLDDVVSQSLNGSPPIGWPASWGNNVVDYGMDPDVIGLEGVQVVKDALKSIPTLSITTDLGNLFDPSIGIYANPYNDGRDWERPASFELIQPDGSAGFQVNAGLRIRGGYSRSTDNPKHAFRLFFRGVYGDSTLDYPMFGTESPVSSFKKLDLRTAQNYSWSFGGDPNNNFIADYFSRLSQLAMGQPATHSDWYHLYLNGQYWGLYQTQERAEAEFAASYFGGNAIDYDVIKPEAGPYAIYATDGNLDAWYRLWDLVRQNEGGSSIPTVASNDVYRMLQGRNPDGSENMTYENLLDVDNLIVYMVNILYGGNLDAPISAFLGNQRVNNFFALRDRTARSGFKFFLHDSEHTLLNVNENRNGPFPAGDIFEYFNPQWLHQRLMANQEYRMRFADLTQRYMFYDGPLSSGAAQARFLSEANKLDQAVIAESARWGDAKRPDAPLTRADWLNAVTAVVGGYLPARGPVVIQQFRNTTLDGTTIARLFPTIDAPTFIVNGSNQHGGSIPPNSTLRFGAASGLVYYTTDGTDPRLFGGGINPLAQVFDPQSTTETVLTAGSSWRYRDTGADLGSAWRQSEYDDTAWASGTAELGYGDGDEATVVSFGPNIDNKYITTYFRKQFSIADATTVTGLKLRLKRDDGAVVYINGVEAVRSNMPVGVISASTTAASAVGGTDESTFFEFEVNPGLLTSGTNMIAIEIHQSSGASSDVSFDAELIVTKQLSASLPMGFLPLQYNARVLSPTGEWSALEQATFSTPLVPASTSNLRIVEIHYNPAPFTGSGSANPPYSDNDNFEFLEFRNISKDVILLDGVTTQGVTYAFASSTSGPMTWLLPGQNLVILKNRAAFEARYQNPGSPYLNIKIAAGDYGSTNLNNGGEGLTVFAANGSIIQQFVYDDASPWPTTPDGGGRSLAVLSSDSTLAGNGANWRASFVDHGTPGIEENDPPIDVFLSQSPVPENSPGALVGTLSSFDYDDLDTFVYSIAPSFDDGTFAVIGNQLRVGTQGLDYESSSFKSIALRSVDSGGMMIEKTFTITVQDVNEAPLLTRGQANVTGNVLTTLSNTGTWSDPEGTAVTLSASLGTVVRNNDGTWTWSYVPSSKLTTQTVVISANDGQYTTNTEFTITALVHADKGSVFYKGSSFASQGIANAIDSSKDLFQSTGATGTSSFQNVINTQRGITGVLIDVAGLVGTSLTTTDFVVRMSPQGTYDEAANPPSAWASAPQPSAVVVTPGTATTAARIRFEWPDNSLTNRWLQVKLLPTANTGLQNQATYYVGHLLGETNGAVEGGYFTVRTVDTSLIAAAIGTQATVTSPLDLNKDGLVRTLDAGLSAGSIGQRLRRITIPPSGSAGEGEGRTENVDAFFADLNDMSDLRGIVSGCQSPSSSLLTTKPNRSQP